MLSRAPSHITLASDSPLLPRPPGCAPCSFDCAQSFTDAASPIRPDRRRIANLLVRDGVLRHRAAIDASALRAKVRPRRGALDADFTEDMRQQQPRARPPDGRREDTRREGTFWGPGAPLRATAEVRTQDIGLQGVLVSAASAAERGVPNVARAALNGGGRWMPRRIASVPRPLPRCNCATSTTRSAGRRIRLAHFADDQCRFGPSAPTRSLERGFRKAL